MKKYSIWISIGFILIFSGCTNMRMAEIRPGCQRGIWIFAWDICEDVEDPTPTQRLKIRGDEELNVATDAPGETFEENDMEEAL